MEFREALKKAMREECGCGGYAPTCAENVQNACYEKFLGVIRSLEAQTGGKFVMPEPTDGMIEATLGYPIEERVSRAIAAAPTVTELVGEK